MAKLIRCECGFVARGDSDDQVVGVIRGHMASDHPALLDTVSREDLLSWIRPNSPAGHRTAPARQSQPVPLISRSIAALETRTGPAVLGGRRSRITKQPALSMAGDELPGSR